MSAQALEKKSILKITRSIRKIVDLINSGNIKTAQLRIDNLLKKNPEDDRVLALKGHVCQQLGDYSEALNYCRNALERSPEKDQYHLACGKNCLLLKDYQTAKTYYMTFLNRNPDHTEALGDMEKIFAELEDKSARLITLLRLAAVNELSAQQRADAFMLLQSSGLLNFSDRVVQGFINILDYEDLDTRCLSYSIGNYVLCTYTLDGDSSEILLSKIFSDELVVKSLPLVRMGNPELEKFFTRMREIMLIKVIQEQGLMSEGFAFLKALALQNYLNEYVFFVSATEKELLNNIGKLIKIDMENNGWQPKVSELLLLLLSTYQGFYQSEFRGTLLQFPIDVWPESLQEIATQTLFNIHQEIELSTTVESLTDIVDQVSLEVQKQYEQNPYPRWNKLCVERIRHIARLVTYFCPHTEGLLPDQLYREDAPILIAGSGTGYQPIASAKRFPKAQVLAVDISRRSLAYSIIKAKEFGVANVRFMHGDILALPDSIGEYYYIECCGVLHHMADPLSGWKKLLSHLAPGGVMKIAVYSQLARRDITVEREKIAKLSITPTEDNIRLYRQALLNQKTLSPVINMFGDFYTLSECRDLIFHQHEQCYTWPQIKAHCEELGVHFLGLVDHSGIDQEFKKRFPGENSDSFELLQTLEEESPYMFRSMYQFLIQKPK